MTARPHQHELEVCVVAIAPVHQVADQVTNGILFVAASGAHELPDGRVSPIRSLLIEKLGIGWEIVGNPFRNRDATLRHVSISHPNRVPFDFLFTFRASVFVHVSFRCVTSSGDLVGSRSSVIVDVFSLALCDRSLWAGLFLRSISPNISSMRWQVCSWFIFLSWRGA